MHTLGLVGTPTTHGVGLDGEFYSLDAQAGRPAVLILLGRLTPAETREALAAMARDLSALDADLVALADIEAPQARAHAPGLLPGARLVLSKPEVFEGWGFRNDTLKLVALAPSGRVLAGPLDATAETVARLRASLATLPRETPFDDASPAPVLVVPDILSPDLCRELIAHFEAGDPQFGGMAAVDPSGQSAHKVDQGKKHRYDLVLGPTDRYLNLMLAQIATRVIPEIAKAFHIHIAHTDRLLLARYDETGGYFKRHRDNAAPAVAFRQFALSINLNDDYDGGHVLFPEYNLRRYRPRAGAGVVFSCSLLHEAAAVTRGHRYCALTFLHDSAAQARWLEGQRRAS